MEKSEVLQELLNIKEGDCVIGNDIISFENLVNEEGRKLTLEIAPSQLRISIRNEEDTAISEAHALKYEELVEIFVFYSSDDDNVRKITIRTKFFRITLSIRKKNFVKITDDNLDSDSINN